MFELGTRCIAVCFALAVSAVAGEVIDLKPFTHTAAIPASADLSSIKFENMKAVKVATKRIATENPYVCDQERLHEPGGAGPCPALKDGSPAPAYRVTYSFNAQPMASDEYGGTRFTFDVYFRPEELDPELVRTISARNVNRVDVEPYFQVSTNRTPLESQVVDEAGSTFCRGNYVDGVWTRSDRTCNDKVTYKTVTRPSEYITVKVASISPRLKQLSAGIKP